MHVQDYAVVYGQAQHNAHKLELNATVKRSRVEPEGARLLVVNKHAVVRLEDLGHLRAVNILEIEGMLHVIMLKHRVKLHKCTCRSRA